MSKLVYLIDQPLDGRNHERFGVQTWIARGWAVEVWDLTPLACPRAWQDFMRCGRELSRFEGYFPLVSRSQLADRLRRLGRLEYFVDLTGDSYYSIRIKMRLLRSGAKRIVCATGSIPEMADAVRTGGRARRWMNVFSRGPVNSLVSLGNAIICRLAAPLIRTDLSIVSGEMSHRSSLASKDNREILRAHNLDYDIYLQLGKPAGGQPGDVVFIDQNICFAPDFIYENAAPYVTPERYFPALRNGLRNISGILDLPVRVAAHPRMAVRNEYPGYFRGMIVEYGRTAELIRGCRLAVCHYSTAAQFAVLFRKPVVFVTTDELECSPAKIFITRFAAALGKLVINLERDLTRTDWHRELHVDSRKYDEYRREYIKTDGSPEIPHWDIVADHVEKTGGRLLRNWPERRSYAAGGR